jgi:SAM-dependent methyltransferase
MKPTAQSSTVSVEEQEFLAWLNCNIPPDVDWRQGALDYMAARLSEENAEHVRRFHLIKPFYSAHGDIPINQQLHEFTREISHFLNILSMLSVSPQTRFLDVACGTGWWTHYLAKLNISVVGIDIAPDMLELTRERLRLDGLPTMHGDGFDHVSLHLHDMEAMPLPPELRCDVAILESALHHFVNPIQTLRNIADSLSDDGIIVILEAASDGQGDRAYTEIMKLYNTLERPYTRDQLVAILNFAGLEEHRFFYPINGFFPPAAGDIVRDQILHDGSWNIVFAAKRSGVLARSLSVTGELPVPETFISPLPPAQSTSPMIQTGELRSELRILKTTLKRIIQKTIGKLNP